MVAPLFEELAFRSCSAALLRLSLGQPAALLGAPLLFSMSHFHHLRNDLRHGERWGEALLLRTFQALYTYLFGLFATFLFFRSGSVFPCMASHALCNSMGTPRLAEALNRPGWPTRLGLLGLNLAGLALFVVLLPRLGLR